MTLLISINLETQKKKQNIKHVQVVEEHRGSGQLCVVKGWAQPQVPVSPIARFAPSAHSVDCRYNPHRSDKIQSHRRKHWLSSAVGTETFV